MYFGSPVAGPFTVGVGVVSLILCLKKKEEKKLVWGAFPSTTETRCSSSFTEATKHLAIGGDKMTVTLKNASCGHWRVHPSPHSLTV